MPENQQTNSSNVKEELQTEHRIVAGVVFLFVFGVFALLFASSCGWFEMSSVFGVCGFKQHTGWPCPGCYITTSGEAFVRGHIIEAFAVQPAGGIFWSLMVVAGVLALLISVFGVNFGFLHKPVSLRFIKYAILLTALVFMFGWVVTLMRTFAQNSHP